MREKKRMEIITARLTPGEKSVIQSQAAKAGMTVTAYLIQCGTGKKIVRIECLQEVLSELKAQGRNINQLAVLANMGKFSDFQVESLINTYGRIYSVIENLAKEVR